MAVTDYDTNAELRARRRTFRGFERLVLFAAMHLALVLACLALAFVGQTPLIALLLGIGGTLGLIMGFVVTANSSS